MHEPFAQMLVDNAIASDLAERAMALEHTNAMPSAVSEANIAKAKEPTPHAIQLKFYMISSFFMRPPTLARSGTCSYQMGLLQVSRSNHARIASLIHATGVKC